MNESFTLREIQPADSAALAELVAASDGAMTTQFVHDAYATITQGAGVRTVGVVAERAGYAGFVGMGSVRFGAARFNGQRLPFAMLDNLKVLRKFRRQGLGRQLAEWRVRRARAEFGDNGLILTGMLTDNHASRAVAQRWAREFVEPLMGMGTPVRSRPPEPMPGITVREARPEEYAAIAAKQNAFFAAYNGYDSVSDEQMANLLGKSPIGRPVYRFFVAADAAGNLVAGARAWYRGLLKVDRLPTDDLLREISVQGLWHLPGQLRSAQHLWEWLRWLCREDGTTLSITFDPRDPTRNAVALEPGSGHQFAIALAVRGPTLIDRSRPFYGLNRV
ncbi:MAG: GNAT family N-acetyltransferase [Chloroflexales bacterium]|nr:GNAT family N-acetyltransferase [Chloroflexales bacterium]